MRVDSHIVISQTILPNTEVIDMDIPIISLPNLKISEEAREVSMYASLEWAIPSLVFIFITKSYFEGFLEEAGIDHYKALKSWILKQNKRFKSVETMFVRLRKANTKFNQIRNHLVIKASIPMQE